VPSGVVRAPLNPDTAAAGGLQPLRVLVAEDDRVQQVLLSAHLEACGCLVDIAEDGEEALQAWREHRHRLVITDCRMPRMDGYAFARALRAEPGGTAVRLVGTSADTDDAPLALAAGMERLLQKPVSPGELAALCEAVRRG
jgi:Response regulators consisting of a CheY-like receiver domain and a winged-helix DNA-binding domain